MFQLSLYRSFLICVSIVFIVAFVFSMMALYDSHPVGVPNVRLVDSTGQPVATSGNSRTTGTTVGGEITAIRILHSTRVSGKHGEVIVLHPGEEVVSSFEGSYVGAVDWYLSLDNEDTWTRLVGRSDSKNRLFVWTVPVDSVSDMPALRVVSRVDSGISFQSSEAITDLHQGPPADFVIQPDLEFARWGLFPGIDMMCVGVSTLLELRFAHADFFKSNKLTYQWHFVAVSSLDTAPSDAIPDAKWELLDPAPVALGVDVPAWRWTPPSALVGESIHLRVTVQMSDGKVVGKVRTVHFIPVADAATQDRFEKETVQFVSTIGSISRVKMLGDMVKVIADPAVVENISIGAQSTVYYAEHLPSFYFYVLSDDVQEYVRLPYSYTLLETKESVPGHLDVHHDFVFAEASVYRSLHYIYTNEDRSTGLWDIQVPVRLFGMPMKGWDTGKWSVTVHSNPTEKAARTLDDVSVAYSVIDDGSVTGVLNATLNARVVGPPIPGKTLDPAVAHVECWIGVTFEVDGSDIPIQKMDIEPWSHFVDFSPSGHLTPGVKVRAPKVVSEKSRFVLDLEGPEGPEGHELVPGRVEMFYFVLNSDRAGELEAWSVTVEISFDDGKTWMWWEDTVDYSPWIFRPPGTFRGEKVRLRMSETTEAEGVVTPFSPVNYFVSPEFTLGLGLVAKYYPSYTSISYDPIYARLAYPDHTRIYVPDVEIAPPGVTAGYLMDGDTKVEEVGQADGWITSVTPDRLVYDVRLVIVPSDVSSSDGKSLTPVLQFTGVEDGAITYEVRLQRAPWVSSGGGADYTIEGNFFKKVRFNPIRMETNSDPLMHVYLEGSSQLDGSLSFQSLFGGFECRAYPPASNPNTLQVMYPVVNTTTGDVISGVDAYLGIPLEVKIGEGEENWGFIGKLTFSVTFYRLILDIEVVRSLPYEFIIAKRISGANGYVHEASTAAWQANGQDITVTYSDDAPDQILLFIPPEIQELSSFTITLLDKPKIYIMNPNVHSW